MTELLLTRRQYAEAIDEPEQLLEPLPQCALAVAYGIPVSVFKLMLPTRTPGTFEAYFDSEWFAWTNYLAVRYGANKAVYLPFGNAVFIVPNDKITVLLRTT